MKSENESLADRLFDYKVSLKNNDITLEQEHLKSIDLVKELEEMELEWKVLRVKMDLLHESASKVINFAYTERHRGLSFRDRMISSV